MISAKNLFAYLAYSVVLISVLCTSGCYAQSPETTDDDNLSKTYKNQIKLNLVPLSFGMTQLSYERGINDRFTIGTSLNFSTTKGVPSFLDFGELGEISFSDEELSGFGIMTQFKWYPGINDAVVPRGFYLGGLLRYQNISYDTDASFQDETTVVNFGFTADLTTVGIGMEVGYQLQFGRFLLDFSFLSPRYDLHTISFTSDTELSDEILDELTQEINNAAGFGVFNKDFGQINLNENESFSLVGFRYAVSIGYAF